LEREGVSHHIHAKRGCNLKITLDIAHSLPIDTLNLVRYLSYVLPWLKARNELYDLYAYSVRNVILRGLR
jgi:hypothetical protein